MYLKMVIDLWFSIDEHAVEALPPYITKFGENGLTTFEGKHVNMAVVEIVAIAHHLDQIRELPSDSPKAILEGL